MLSQKIKHIKEYFIGVKQEARKINWISFEEANKNTLIVLSIVLSLSILFLIVDKVAQLIVNLLLSSWS